MENDLNKMLSLVQTGLMAIALLGATILIICHTPWPVLLFMAIWLVFLGVFRECLRDTFKAFGILPRKPEKRQENANRQKA